MNYVSNQNGKVLEETLAGVNPDTVKTTPKLFQNDPLSFASSSKISPYSFLTLSHTIQSIKNGSVR